jgi:hypothetical protein
MALLSQAAQIGQETLTSILKVSNDADEASSYLESVVAMLIFSHIGWNGLTEDEIFERVRNLLDEYTEHVVKKRGNLQ